MGTFLYSGCLNLDKGVCEHGKIDYGQGPIQAAKGLGAWSFQDWEKRGPLERRPYGPGVHGNRRKKISDYAIRLKEKQKLLYHYGLREKQLVKYVRNSKRDTSGKP